SYDQVHIHNGEYLHNKGYNGTGIIIAIIDAGFYKYKTIKAFDSIRARNGFLGERDFVTFDGSVNEDDSHGENCLSIIGSNVPGSMVGTAPGANFWLLRGENTASEMPIEEHNWAAAAEFADSAGADMISSSLGYFTFDNAALNHTYADFYQNTTMCSRAATYAAKKGMIVTNSAGNEGGSSWKYIIFPADSDSVCAVAATNTSGNIAYFSSYGYPGKVKPNISSVGDGTTIYTSYGVSYGSGTSFSNPNINGLIACLWQAFPDASNMQILKAVYASGDKYKTPDNRFGYGTPNMAKAYRILQRQSNQLKYGDEWIFANATPHNREIAVKLIGRKDGKAQLSLVGDDSKPVIAKTIVTEEEEIYNLTLALPAGTQPGKYTLVYDDGTQTRKINIFEMKPQTQKKSDAAAPKAID
ncbi:MAG TPA: S8 family serine peptidase, partial [Chitinophagaceae bacterium]|nr:S8 family serine peptidase [Chitinophagaceae bacterium]